MTAFETKSEALRSYGQTAMAGLFSLAVFSLILIHVFDIDTEDIKSFFAPDTSDKVVGRKGPKNKAGDVDEIRQYSEFVIVKHKTLNLQITTGIRYDNSSDQNIESQWCYARARKGTDSGFSVHLTIQEINDGETLSYAPFAVQTLREFGLTQVQAKDLTSYCRFR
ncbi:hypothetical protein JQV19_06190 [Sulfitobacter mediterraneus]|uniref:hypothetical protein n=1 Tax=Sulfitobacter mediterraneus TaxID=83219 RepID=UPI001939FFA3|nr:hypothetical protein [Sulfitobacter mediterraneus]MBM1556238.1 hypothetical protein [Sulfitobacter mediterraneus]MBM1567724.1 hypothetical protein [Sulfitobacter mediterraneus]MBM1571592.1 hypothetical protein [Sulfitobacter mediterraneus]MBM1575380.1 hypothetical protein [Sulfitobacter mediterraneus]MBM1579129.1 hypothetical protein [Sulfitobacter mediterraneus]